MPPERWSIDAHRPQPAAIGPAQRGVYRELSFRQTEPGAARPLLPAHRPRGWPWPRRPPRWPLPAREPARTRSAAAARPLRPDPVPQPADLPARGRPRQALATLWRLLRPGGSARGRHGGKPTELAGRAFVARRTAPDSYLPLYGRGTALPSDPAAVPVARPRALGRRRHALSGSPHSAAVVAAQVTVQTALAGHPGWRAQRHGRRAVGPGRARRVLGPLATRPGPSGRPQPARRSTRQSAGRRAAAPTAFRKALYLDPDHERRSPT